MDFIGVCCFDRSAFGDSQAQGRHNKLLKNCVMKAVSAKDDSFLSGPPLRAKVGAALTLSDSSQSKRAIYDLIDGLRSWRIWGLLGWEDIRQRYRRSTLGPLWLTISMGAMVVGMGFLYSGLFRTDVSDYLPFLTLGFIIWGLISGFVSDGCRVFIQAEPIIKQVQLAISVHVYRMLWRHLIIFAHNIVIFVLVAMIFSLWPGWAGPLVVPGLLILFINGLWVGVLLGLISARFRDVPQIIGSVLQVAFFLTPIIWKPEHLPARSWFVDLNPFYHFVEIVRAPLLGQALSLRTWATTLLVTAAGWSVTFIVYCLYRRRIAYWL